MRFLSTKTLFLTSIFFIAENTLVSAQDTSTKVVIDSIVNRFKVQTIIPKPEQATVVIHEDPQIQRLLNIKAKMDKDGAFSDRYRIQLYYGNLVEANEIGKTAKEKFEKWETDIKWQTPNYKVWIGNFRSSLEADRALKEIQKEFPNAFKLKPEKK